MRDLKEWVSTPGRTTFLFFDLFLIFVLAFLQMADLTWTFDGFVNGLYRGFLVHCLNRCLDDLVDLVCVRVCRRQRKLTWSHTLSIRTGTFSKIISVLDDMAADGYGHRCIVWSLASFHFLSVSAILTSLTAPLATLGLIHRTQSTIPGLCNPSVESYQLLRNMPWKVSVTEWVYLLRFEFKYAPMIQYGGHLWQTG